MLTGLHEASSCDLDAVTLARQNQLEQIQSIWISKSRELLFKTKYTQHDIKNFDQPSPQSRSPRELNQDRVVVRQDIAVWLNKDARLVAPLRRLERD